jgi:hypothetical protein
VSEWDPTNHIENLFESVKEGVEKLYAMDAIANKDISKTCVSIFYFFNRWASFKAKEFTYSKFQQILNSTTHQILSMGGSLIP